MASSIPQSALQTESFGAEMDARFRHVPDEFQHILKANKRGFRAGTILKIEGGDSSSVYVVLSGWLALSKSLADGARQIVDIVLPGGIVDPTSADGDTSAVQIEALSYAKVAVVPRGAWTKFGASEPMARHLQAATIAAAQSRMSERMLRLGKGSAETRIAYALIELCMRAEAIGERRKGVCHLPLTQQLLGEYVGLTSVHVCRTMRRLTRNGVISIADHMDIVIRDPDTLADIAGVDLASLRQQIIPQH